MAWLRNSYSQFTAKWQLGKSLTQIYPKWELTEVALHLISTHLLCIILLSNQFRWTIAHESLDFDECDIAVVVTSNGNTDLWTVLAVAVKSKSTWIIWIFSPPILQLIAEVWPTCCRHQHENLFRSILLPSGIAHIPNAFRIYPFFPLSKIFTLIIFNGGQLIFVSILRNRKLDMLVKFVSFGRAHEKTGRMPIAMFRGLIFFIQYIGMSNTVCTQVDREFCICFFSGILLDLISTKVKKTNIFRRRR